MGRGRTIPFSLPRRLVCDLVHFAHQVPTVPVQRIMRIAQVQALRSELKTRPSWCALFTKAYALVAVDFPELRRAYLPFPWARLYEHPHNVASIAVERIFEGEPGVFFGHIHCPEGRGIMELDDQLRRYKEDPIDSIADFRSSLAICRMLQPIRRMLWWYVTHARGRSKARRLGTFGVSVYSSLGAESLHPLSPLTTAVNYGVIQENGDVTVRVIYDHRVMDGATVARALARLEEVLNQDILAELRELREQPPAPLQLNSPANRIPAAG
jgi:hypothetical protein